MTIAALPLSSAVRLRLTGWLKWSLRLRRLGEAIGSSEFYGNRRRSRGSEEDACGKAQPYRTGERQSRIVLSKRTMSEGALVRRTRGYADHLRLAASAITFTSIVGEERP